MTCRQVSTFNGTTGSGKSGGGGYATEADCLQACKEGACCEGTTCTVKPQCQCQGAGKVFKGVGTVCTPNPCTCVPGGCADFTVTVNGLTRVVSIAGNPGFSTQSIHQIGTTSCGGNAYVQAWCEQGIIGFPSCDNASISRRRVYFDAVIGFGCFGDINSVQCGARFVQSFVFDRYDSATGVPLGPPCSLGSRRLESSGSAACSGCQQYADCVAESYSVSIVPSCNPLP